MELFWDTLNENLTFLTESDEEVQKTLGKWRSENYFRHKTKLGRALSFCAGMTLKRAFSANDMDLASLEPSFGENGKPYFEGIEFNMSHSGEVALVAVSKDFSPVGCDVQIVQKKDLDRIFAIAERFFSVRENEKMQELRQGDFGVVLLLFYIIFSAKEAYIKMTGEGLKRSMDSFEIPIDEEIISSLSLDHKHPIEKCACIDERNVKFTFYLPEFIKNLNTDNKIMDDYVAVTCKIV